MTPPDRVRRDGDEPGPIGSVVRLFLGQLAAVIVIATAITVVVTMLDPDDADLRTATPGSRSGAAVASGSPSPSAPAGQGQSSAPATTAPPPSTPPAVPSTRTPKRPRVDVLNQSAPGGSAAQIARQLRAAGWRIGRVDDFSGNVSTTTVYWLDRADRKDARRLARELGGVRVQPGFSTLVEGRISVVLVD
jgi:hypothetical protein